MPVYSVDIPGSGSYDVESDKELTDAQAYQYALIQANQIKAHEAKTGFKPAMSSAFQKALGSADVGIAGILGGLGFPEESQDFTQAAEKRKQRAAGTYEPTTEQDVAAAEARGVLPGLLAQTRKNVSEPLGGFVGRFGPTMAATATGTLPLAAIAGGAEYLTGAGEIQERGGSPEAAYTAAAPLAALNVVGLPFGSATKGLSSIANKALGRATAEGAEQSVLGAARVAQETAAKEGEAILSSLEGKAAAEATAAPYRAATEAASEEALKYTGKRTAGDLTKDFLANTAGNVAVGVPNALAQEAIIRSAAGQEAMTPEEMGAISKQMALLSPFFGGLHTVMSNPAKAIQQKAMETAEGVRTRPEALTAEEQVKSFAEPEIPEPTLRGEEPIAEEPAVEEPTLRDEEEPVVEEPTVKTNLGKDLGLHYNSKLYKALNELDTTDPAHVLKAAELIREADAAGSKIHVDQPAIDAFLKRADEFKVAPPEEVKPAVSEPSAAKLDETLQAKTDALKANAAEATPKTTKDALKATLDHDVAEQEAKLDELDKFDEPAPETPEAAKYTGTAADAKDTLMADRLSVMRDFEKPSIAQAVKNTAKNFIYNHVDKYAPAISKIGKQYGEYVDDGHLNAGPLGHQHDQAHTLMTNAFQEGGLEFDKSGQVRIRRKEIELSDGRKMNASLGNMVKLADETGADGRDVLSEVLRTLDEERQLKLDPSKASVWVTKNPEAFKQKVAAAHQLLKDKPIFNDMINMNREVNKMRVDFLRDSGQIDKDTHAFFLAQDDYVPRYLTREDTLDLLGPSKGRKIRVGNTQTRVFQERDVANHDVNPLENIGREFTRSYLGGWSNNLKRLSAEQLVKTGNAEYVGRTNNPAKQGNVAVLHNGERRFYKLNDPNDIPAMRIADDVLGPFMQAHAAATQTLRLGALNTPFYFIKQLSRDPIAATLTSDLGWITPLHSLREVSGLLTNNKETRRIYNKLHDYGVIGAIDPTMSPRQLGSFNKEMGTRLKSGNSLGMAKLKMINSLEFTHKAIDASTRIAVFREAYRKAIREGKSHEAAEEYAVMKARESINFSVGGNAELQRKARMLVPFLGSGINALEVLRKAIMMPHIKESERAAFRKQFLNKAYTVGMLAGAHALMMAGDPDYEDAENSFKYNNLLIPTGSKEHPFFGMSLPPDLAFLYWIPSMLVSATLGTKDSSQLWGAAREQLKTMVPGNLAYSYGIPQLERPLLEGIMGKSFYTGQDIESASEKGKLPENRGEYTASGVGKIIGKAGGISPTIIDHMARGYLGEVGKAAAWFADTLLDATGVSDGVTKPELDWTQIPGTSAQTAFGRHLGSQALDDFYTRKEEADVLRKTFNDYRKSGDLHADDLKEFTGDRERMLKKNLADDMDRWAKQISNLNNQIRMVERSKLSKEEITDRVERFKVQRNKLAAVANAKWKATMEQ